MPGWLGKKNKGQTTVFLSLALVLIISLICTLLESARSEGLRLRLQTAANAAIASAFSMYDIQVWERYGLLFFADRIGNGQEFREVVDRYTGLNTREDDAVGGDWISFSEASSADISYVLATDDHGEVFVRAVCTYMRQCGLIREIKDMQEQWNSAREKISGLDMTNSEGELDLGRIGNLLEQVQEGLEDFVQAPDGATAPSGGDGAGNGEGAGAAAEESAEAMSLSQALEIFAGLTQKLENWRRRGLLMVVCSRVPEVSEKPISRAALPSALGGESKDRRAGEPMDHDLIDNLIFREYLLTHLNSYREKPGEMLELEYTLTGKDSDLASLSSTVKRLAAVRTGLNYIFLQTHSDYRLEIAGAAAALAILVGSGEAVEAIEMLLTLLWALAEAVCDVRMLMGGKKVPLIKEEQDWKLSLRGAALADESGEGGGRGLEYKDYIRLLLYLAGTDTLAYRAMDCIQIFARKKDSDFLMKNCIYAARISIDGKSGSGFPFLPGELEYTLRAGTAFSYGEIEY